MSSTLVELWMLKSKSYETHTQLGNIKQPKVDIVHICNKVHWLLNCEDLRYFFKEVTFEMQTVALYTQSGKEKDSLLEWYIDIRHFLDYAYHLSAADITSEQQQQKKK